MSCSQCDDSCRHYLPDGGCVLKLANNGGMSQREVAKVLGVSKTRVWQIEVKALDKLKRYAYLND